MAGYIIALVQVADPEEYKKYTAQTPAAVAAAGGRFIVRGGAYEVPEGSLPEGTRIVVIEFPSYEAAKAFYHCEAYAQIKKIRLGASTATFIMVEGHDG